MRRQSTSAPVALVTGASSGIGLATARLLARNGFRVYGTSRIARLDQGTVRMLTLDVRSHEAVSRCVATVLSQAGQIDVLVNNAGVMHEGFAEETDIAEAKNLLRVNFLGPVSVVHAVLPHMRERRAGRIVMVGSLAAWIGEPGESFYAASKAALARYTEALRHEMWPLGIDVSLVEPGAFTSGVLHAASSNRNTIGDYDGIREAARATLHKSMRRGGHPTKVASTILKVITARSPLGRYGVGRGSRVVPLAKLLLPQRMIDLALRRSFHLHREPAAGRNADRITGTSSTEPS